MDMDETLYNNDDRIERYLQGEMTPEEEAIFEEDLANDDTLRRQAEAMARIVKGMEAVGGEQDRLLIDKMKAANGKRLAPVWWMSIAAGLVIIFTMGYHFYDRSQTIDMGRQYAYVFPAETIIRGEEDENAMNKLTVLFENVANGNDIDYTIIELSQLWELAHSDTYNEYTTYESLIGWNLAMAHLQKYDKKAAKTILDKLIEEEADDEESTIREKAIELRSKL